MRTDSAKQLARRGLRVFPCIDKRPALTGWQSKATKEPNEIDALWRSHPDSNIGIATGAASGVWVLDVDPRHGGMESLEGLSAVHGPIPETWTVQTGGGGLHLYFYHDPRIKNSVGFNPGLDTRSDGGLVIGPGSLHSSGVEYRWKPGCGPDDTPLADAPEWLIRLITGANGNGKAKAATAAVGPIPEGERNAALFKLGCSLRVKGLSSEAIEAALEVENRERCNPPLSIDEVKSIAESCGRYQRGQCQTIGGNEIVQPEASGAVENPELDPLTAEVQRLAGLSDIEYDQQRKDAAKRLNIRVGTLDAERNRLRGGGANESKQLAFLTDPEPWPDPVDGADLLDDLAGLFSKYIVLPKGGAEALALWTVFTFAHDCFPVCPMLSLQSAEKQSGKTTTLAILSAVCRKPLPLSNISAAATFRVIEKYQPTLILDESETYLRGDNEELRGILNSGHTRPTAFVIRCNGDSLEPEIFSTWTPKAFGLIGTLPDTLADRSIILPMARKKPGDSVERNRLDTLPEETEPLRARAARWAMDNTLRLRAADPESIPEGLNDRAQDNWRPLLAIADAAGGIWPDLARKVALILRGEGDADSIGATLLRDIRTIFDQTGSGYLSSEHLCRELSQMEAQPWGEWRHGKPITPAGVAKRLKAFGIKPTQTREGLERSRGYDRKAFQDAWERYISP